MSLFYMQVTLNGQGIFLFAPDFAFSGVVFEMTSEMVLDTQKLILRIIFRTPKQVRIY